MSDTVSRKALDKDKFIQWMENKLFGAKDSVIYQKVISGEFDLPTEPEGEIESLKAITELAVKELKSIAEIELKDFPELAKFILKGVNSTLSRIEGMKK